VSGSGISWAIVKSAPRSRQITTPTPHHSFFYRPDALPATQPTVSKHRRQNYHNSCVNAYKLRSTVNGSYAFRPAVYCIVNTSKLHLRSFGGIFFLMVKFALKMPRINSVHQCNQNAMANSVGLLKMKAVDAHFCIVWLKGCG